MLPLKNAWLFRLARLLKGSRAPLKKQQKTSFRPQLEILEDRIALATFVVNTLDDNGQNANPIAGSLRQAVMELDKSKDAENTIYFNITKKNGKAYAPPNEPLKLQLDVTPLPAITKQVIIDGTPPEKMAKQTITLEPGPNQAKAFANASGLVFQAGADGSKIYGLTISGFGQNGIYLDNVSSIRIGAIDGSKNTFGDKLGNGQGTMTIIGNANAGILIHGSKAIKDAVVASYIGTNSESTDEKLNQNGTGVLIDDGATQVTIGMGTACPTTVGAGLNVISNNKKQGIFINEATQILIAGNYIGTNVDGDKKLPNGSGGIGTLLVNNIQIGTAVAVEKGQIVTPANVISGNNVSPAVYLVGGGGGKGFQVYGNFIGTDKSGLSPLGNSSSGIQLTGVNSSFIGGKETGQGNVIADNGGLAAIYIIENSQNNLIQNNWIGTGKDGKTELLNKGDGVQYDGTDAKGNLVKGNTIVVGKNVDEPTNSPKAVNDPNKLNKTVDPNSIFGGGYGIYTGTEYGSPVLSSAVVSNDSITIQGTLTSTPSSSFVLEFFGNPDAVTPGFEQGEYFLGTTTITTDVDGDVSFSVTFNQVMGSYVSATATGTAANGYTSQFSAYVAMTGDTPNPIPVPTVSSLSATTGSGAGGTSVTIVGTGFTQANIVYFGDIPVSNFTVLSDSSMTVTSPPNVAGTVDVTVGSLTGLSDVVSGDQFTFTAPSLPGVSSLDNHTGTTDGNATVNIVGSNFLGATDVFFGGVKASSFTVNSSTSITAITPPQSAGTFDVTVSTLAGGTSATSPSDTFTVTNAAAPTITALDNDTGTTAGDAVVDITGTGFDSATGVSFGTYGASFTINSDTSITAISPAQSSGNVDVTVTSYSGTSSTSSADTFSYANASAPTVTGLSLTSGSTSGGDLVIIAGSNLTGAATVSFGSVAVPFTVLSDNAVEAITPAESADTVNVTVSTYSGTSSTSSADVFTFNAPPLPTVTVLSSDTGTTVGGEFLTVTGTGFTTAYEVDFGNTPLFNFTINSDSQITLFTPAAPAGQIDIQVDTDAGTSLPNTSDNFTFLAAVPTVTSLSSDSGTTAGGTVVNITGSNFDSSAVVFFGGVAATSVTVNSATSITAVAPPEPAGTYDVTVWTMSGSSAPSSSDTFSVSAVTPVVTSLGADTGTTAGGTLVAITGSSFTGATAVYFGSVAADFAFQSDSLLTAYAPAQTAGTYHVTVVTGAGTSSTSSADEFTYSNDAAPVVSGLDVNTGPTSGGTTVTILGSGFTAASGVNFGSLAAASYVINSDTSITAVSPLEAAGNVNITVTTYAGTSSTSSADTFAFTNVTAPAPTVTGLDFATGSTAGGQVVTITGTDFSGTTAVDFGGLGASSYSMVSDSSIVAVAPAESAGTVHITVTTNNGTSSTSSADEFTYLATAAPAITSLSSSSGTTAGNATITLTGTNFSSASAVNFGLFAAASYTVTSSTSITAVTPALPAGSYNLVVITPSGTSAPTTFTVTDASLPVVTGLGTDTSSTAGGGSISITGSNFTGAIDVLFGGVEASSFTINSGTSITAIVPPQYAGGYDVTVVTYAGTSALSSADRFTYTLGSAPTVTGLSSDTATTAGGVSITLTGTNFSDAYDVLFGSVSADSFTINSSTSITALVPAEEAGTVNVTVWTMAGTSASGSADTVTYINASAPTVTALSTHTGTTGGGTVVTITGANFSEEATVSFGSVAATSVTVNSATSITAVSPVEAAGNINVTVTTYAGTSATSSADTFSITNASAPTVSGVSASSGSVLGGDAVTITGSGFTGATGVSFGTTPAASYAFVSDTAIVAIDPAAAATGTVDVTVTTLAGTSATGAADHFTYNGVSAPTVTSLSSDSGTTGGGDVLTVTGTGFTSASAVDIDGSPVASFVVLGDSSIQVTTAPNIAGTFDLTVTASGLTSALSSSDRFTYNAASAPTVTGLSSDTGTTAGGLSVTITGTGFTGASGVFFGGISASFVINSSTSITAVTPSETAGTVYVTVSSPTGTSAVSSSNTFTYSNAPDPTVSALSLTTGTTVGGITVTITGSNFTGATYVYFGTVQAAFSILNDSYLTAEVPIQASGTVNVTVVTASGTSATSLADEFTYTSASSPTVTAVAGNSGAPQGGNEVLVLGSGFTGATSVDFGSTAAASFTVISDSAILVTAPGPMSTGTVDITVTTPVGTSSTSSSDTYSYTGPLVLDGVDGLTVSGLTLADGVEIIDSTNITLQDNTIGTLDVYNTYYGISIDAASSNITIGGSGSGQGNTIYFSGQDAVLVAGSNVVLLGNTISYNGLFLAPADGVDVAAGANNVIIGGSASSDGNYIANNTGDGVYIDGTNVIVQSNTIYSNSQDGIDVAAGASSVTIGSSISGNSIGASNTGIEVAGTHVAIVGNTFSSNSTDVLIDGGTSVTFSDTTVSSLVITSGYLTVNGSSTIGTLTISGGTLSVAADLTVTGDYDQTGGTLNVGATLDLTGGTFYMGGGVLELSGGTVESTVDLSISSGALEGAGTIDGNVDNSGTIALGAPYARGALTITGDYTQESTGALTVNLDSLSLSVVDQLFIDGTATLGGTFTATLASGYTPTSGNVLNMLQASDISGSFASINLPSYSGGSLSSSMAGDDFELTAHSSF